MSPRIYRHSILILLLCTGALSLSAQPADYLSTRLTFGGIRFTEGGQITTRKHVREKLKVMPEASQLMTKASRQHVVGTVGALVGGFGLGWAIAESFDNKNANTLLISSSVVSIVAFEFSRSAHNNERKAIDLYNARNCTSSALRPHFRLGTNGTQLQLAVRF